jgi:hypothetical protein
LEFAPEIIVRQGRDLIGKLTMNEKH